MPNRTVRAAATGLPKIPREIDALVGSAARELESPVCDLVNMIELVVDHYQHLLKLNVEKGEVCIGNWQADLALFAIYQVSNMGKDLQTQFYAALEGKEPSDA